MPLKQREDSDYSPSSHHAEMTLLGAMLVSDRAFSEAEGARIEAFDFVLSSHQQIFAAIERLQRNAQPVDIVTVAEELRHARALESIGGVPYLASLSEGLPRKLSVESYARIIKEKSRLREVIRMAEGLLDAASGQQIEASDIAVQTIAMLTDLANTDLTNDMPHVKQYLDTQGEPEQMFDQFAAVDGVKLGITDLDRITSGLQKAELVVVAARPSMGKTAFVVTVTYHTAVRLGLTTAVFTLEQKRKAFVRRMLSGAARVDYRAIKDNKLSRTDRDRLLDHRKRIMDAPLYLDDSPGLTVSRIRAKAMRLKATVGLDILFIDQLSKVDSSDVYRHGMQGREIIGKQTGALKRLAQDLDIPVVLLNQISREAGKRKDFIPVLSDLKESGSLEEDADVVIFLHRPEYYDKAAENKGKGVIIVAKQREGPTGTIDCVYEGNIMRWENEAPDVPDYAYDQRSFAPEDTFSLDRDMFER